MGLGAWKVIIRFAHLQLFQAALYAALSRDWVSLLRSHAWAVVEADEGACSGREDGELPGQGRLGDVVPGCVLNCSHPPNTSPHPGREPLGMQSAWGLPQQRGPVTQ